MKVLARQSLFDIALHQGGSIEAIFELAGLNDLSITDNLEAGSDIVLSETVLSKRVKEYYSTNNIFPATSITENESAETISQEGIGYWAIEVDFVVS